MVELCCGLLFSGLCALLDKLARLLESLGCF